MCQEKVRLAEFGEEVVLCCDKHLTPGFHYDQIQNVEWRVPYAEVKVRNIAPLDTKELVNAL